MIDNSNFFRVRSDTVEIFVTGLSHSFTNTHDGHVKYDLQQKSADRVKYICNEIYEYRKRNNLTLSEYTQVILDCRLENFYMGSLGKKVAESLNLNPNNTKILVGVDPKGTLLGYDYEVDLLADVNSCCFYENLIQENIDWENIEVDMPIISLAGRPTEYRARFTKELINLCGDRARISLGNVSQLPLSDIRRKTYEALMHPYGFPFSQGTDGKILGYILYQHGIPGHQLFRSLLHLVNETNDFLNDNIQLSEKSFKVFAWHQIPIFMASPKQVETVRNIGFDMFDDIIDHSYDYAPNLGLHDIKVLNIVAKFLKAYPTIESVNELRKKLYPRLKANNDLLYSLYKNRKYEPWPYYS
jgi:hypothetical protein